MPTPDDLARAPTINGFPITWENGVATVHYPPGIEPEMQKFYDDLALRMRPGPGSGDLTIQMSPITALMGKSIDIDGIKVH